METPVCTKCITNGSQPTDDQPNRLQLFLAFRDLPNMADPSHDHTAGLTQTVAEWGYSTECGDHIYFSLVSDSGDIAINYHLRTPCINPYADMPLLTFLFLFGQPE